ncbi:general substrate transporter [Lipomyces doorenjongii]|uniref:general substrate transporter n=1 Tax=Lipomyces doorenjongii TaxID=383834 RepID=UPI0034CF43A1
MSTSPTYMRLKGQSLVYAVTMSCSMGFLLFGFDIAFMGGLTTSTVFLDTFNNPNSSLLGFLISAYEVGALFGALAEFVVGDRFGRKPNNVVGIIIVTIGAIIQASSFGIAQFLVGRFVAGFGLGIVSTVIPIWLAECTLPKSRGRMMAMQLSNMLLGLIIATWLVYGVSFYSSSIQWRLPCAAPSILCLIPFLPESPRYLAATGQSERASYVLAALRGHSEDHPEVMFELQEIRYAIAVESQEAGSWSDVFKDHGISGWQRVLISWTSNFVQQMSGVNNSVGLSSHNALLVSGGLQVFYFLSSLIPWYVVDRVGRRRLFLLGSMGMGTCMLLSAVFVGIGTKGLGYAAIVVLYLFQTFFTLGWQSNMWIYPSELLPLKLRLRGGALSVVSQWLFTFVVVEITPVMISNITYKSYIVFALLNFVTIPVVYFFFPETSQLPLEMVDQLFADRDGKRPSIFRAVRDSTNKEFIAEMEVTLAERTKAREENERILDEAKHAVEHLEKSV